MRPDRSNEPIWDDDRVLHIGMIGWVPHDQPYLSIRENCVPGRTGGHIGSISSRRALRALARRILVALGEGR